MKVEVAVQAYEVDGEDLGYKSGPELKVRSHWNRNGVLGFVVVEFPGGKTLTVPGQDLIKAAQRCLDIG